MTTPAETPPRDVTTTNRANAPCTGSRDHGEFDKPDEEEEAKAKAAASRRRGTTTSSSDMAGWELIRYQERDYVPAASIHKFYRFNNLEVNGNNVWFRSPVLVMKATLGSQDLLINNIKFVLSDPVVELQGQALLLASRPVQTDRSGAAPQLHRFGNHVRHGHHRSRSRGA